MFVYASLSRRRRGQNREEGVEEGRRRWWVVRVGVRYRGVRWTARDGDWEKSDG